MISLFSVVITGAIFIEPLSIYAQKSADINVDFTLRKNQTKSVSGFLHAMDAALPSDNLIAPLKPKLWRAGTLATEIYPRAVNFGARFTVILSDIWGYDVNNARADTNQILLGFNNKIKFYKLSLSDLIFQDAGFAV
jgi:hypothetical protein